MRARAKRLVTKVGASPVLPVLAWTKVVESVIVGGPVLAWVGVGVVASGWFVVAEAFVEYLDTKNHDMTEYFSE